MPPRMDAATDERMSFFATFLTIAMGINPSIAKKQASDPARHLATWRYPRARRMKRVDAPRLDAAFITLSYRRRP